MLLLFVFTFAIGLTIIMKLTYYEDLYFTNLKILFICEYAYRRYWKRRFSENGVKGDVVIKFFGETLSLMKLEVSDDIVLAGYSRIKKV